MTDIDEAYYVKNVIMKVIWQRNVNFHKQFVTFVENKGMKPMTIHWKNQEDSMSKRTPRSM